MLRHALRRIIRPMLDIKLIREKPDFVRQRLATRGRGDEARLSEIAALDEKRRKLLTESDTLKAQRNQVSKEIGVAEIEGTGCQMRRWPR